MVFLCPSLNSSNVSESICKPDREGGLVDTSHLSLAQLNPIFLSPKKYFSLQAPSIQ